MNRGGPGLDAWLDAELARHNLGPEHALVGFSQGTMMALHLALRRRAAGRGIVGYSGLLVLEEGKGAESLKAEIRATPPILSSTAIGTT